MYLKNKTKILCPDPSSFSIEGLNFLKKNFDADIKELTQIQFDKVAFLYDAVLIRFNKSITKKTLKKNSKLKFILCPTTGLDHIDAKLCKKQKINIISLKNQKKFLEDITSTSELAIGLLINIMRNINPSISSVKNNKWNFNEFRGYELKDKIIGIIGMGRLGKIVGKIAKAFTMNVIFYDIEKMKIEKFKQYKTVDKVFDLSDIISIHLPLNSKTKHFLSFKEFNLMKKKPFIINTSRGSIINSKALLDALKKNKIKGAALDVIENENKNKNNILNPLINYSKKNKNLIITPHIGGCTYEANFKTDIFVLEKYLSHVKKGFQKKL